MRHAIGTLAAASALMAASPAFAAELITNGGFENGPDAAPPQDWDVSPGSEILTISDTLYASNAGGVNASGNRFASFGAGDLPNVSTLSQALGTIAGQSYAVNFAFGTFGGTAQSLTVNVFDVATDALLETFSFAPPAAGNNLQAIVSPATFSFTATGASRISFSVDAGTASYDGLLDNVSVTGAVPEPATWAMMILGFGAIGGALRSRRRARAALRFA